MRTCALNKSYKELTSKKSSVHNWLKKNYGAANKCENILCKGESSEFQWAKIHTKLYEPKIENFHMLCRKCHAAYDHKFKRNICRKCLKEYYNHEGSYIDGIKFCRKMIRFINNKSTFRGDFNPYYLSELLSIELDSLGCKDDFELGFDKDVLNIYFLFVLMVYQQLIEFYAIVNLEIQRNEQLIEKISKAKKQISENAKKVLKQMDRINILK